MSLDLSQLPYVKLPQDTLIFYLDTCVWGELLDKSTRSRLVEYFLSGNRVIVISQATMFELSRAFHTKQNEWDDLFYDLRHCLYTPPPYELIIQSEIASFPEKWQIVWLFLGEVINSRGPAILKTLTNNSLFVDTREDYRAFGAERFMKLEDYKKNFPPLHGKVYSVEDAPHFSWAVTLDYLIQQFPSFAKKNWNLIRGGENGPNIHLMDNIQSLRARNLLIFFKYYLHNQSPIESDFFDFYHVSFVPYSHVFVTEKNLSNVLKHIKTQGLMFDNINIRYFKHFLEDLS